jgi:CheY-like chemotaxis protein
MALCALIVDDSRLACKVMSNMLESFNIESVAVFSAEQALDHLKHSQPNMIFLDHTMPGMDGFQAIKIIKSNPLTATIPVLMYTAKEGDVYVGQARALGAVDVLPKGLEKHDLLSSLKELGLVSLPEIEEQTSTGSMSKVDTISFNSSTIEDSSDNENEGAEQESGSTWESIWRYRLQPFMKNHKVIQSNELVKNTDIQTRKLTKEFYRILEEFEYVFAQRLDSRDDFLEAQKEQSARHRHKQRRVWLTAFCLFQSVFLWQLWESNQYNRALVENRQTSIDWQDELSTKIAQLDQKLLSIDSSITTKDNDNEKLSESSTMADPNKNSGQSTLLYQQSLSLIDDSGALVAELIPTDPSRGQYMGITSTGYQFEVNAKGDLSFLPEVQYYQTNDCTGDSFVQSDSAMVYRDDIIQIWYVDKFSVESETIVSSKSLLDQGCIALDNELVNVRGLQKDLAFETGLDLNNGLRVLMK